MLENPDAQVVEIFNKAASKNPGESNGSRNETNFSKFNSVGENSDLNENEKMRG